MTKTQELAKTISAVERAAWKVGLRVVLATVSATDHALLFAERAEFLRRFEEDHGYPADRGNTLPMMLSSTRIEYEPTQHGGVRFVVEPYATGGGL
jgi:hypothetical protein